MYIDKKRRRWPLVLCGIALAAVLALVFWQGRGLSRQEMEEEGAQAVKNAVRQSAMQCYAVEGAYPPTLEHLEENYGLQINREDFYVVYDVFAVNLPPEVTVVPRPRQETGLIPK
ncbi:MAG: hypothetical protein HFE88_03400 [Acutalibacter sp.]|nr:hypothetical protein [Acutalibacter sp.]